MATQASPACVTETTAPALPWPTFRSASIAVFLVSMDSAVLFAALGSLRQAFPAATAASLSWVLDAYTVVYAAMLIPTCGLADKHERKRLFLVGLALFLAVSAACGSAASVEILIVAQMVQAVGVNTRPAPRGMTNHGAGMP